MIIVGVDEVGLGSWVGPATVCALACYLDDQSLLMDLGVRDSKTLSAQKMRSLIGPIADIALGASVVMAPLEEIDADFKGAWRTAVRKALQKLNVVGQRIIVDGSADSQLRIRGVEFVVKADSKFPVVSAASIVAKTVRDDLLAKMGEEHPEYGWSTNAGYHSKAHVAAIAKFGKTKHHRQIKPLIGAPCRS